MLTITVKDEAVHAVYKLLLVFISGTACCRKARALNFHCRESWCSLMQLLLPGAYAAMCRWLQLYKQSS